MPLTEKGKKIMSSMKEEYGPEGGERVFYASENKGRIRGVEKARGRRRKRRRSSRKNKR